MVHSKKGHSRLKQVKTKHNPPDTKEAKLRKLPPSDATAKFTWRVKDKYIDYSHPKFGWCNCETLVLLKDVIQELQDHEGLTWQQIREKTNHNHSWDFSDIPGELQTRLAELQLDYLPELFQLALANVPRIWGFKDITTFYLIWYDPQHEGYKTKVK